MRTLAAVCILAAAASTAFAGGTKLSGIVKDSNGKPLAKVIVRVAPTDRSGGYRPVQAETDEKGRFALETEERGPHSVTIQSVKPGDAFTTSLPPVDVEGEKQNITLQLSKSEITGSITCKDTGKPPGDKVNVSLYLVKPWSLAGMAWVDKEGKYRFRGFPPGRYRIYITVEGYRKAQQEFEIKKNKKKKGVDFVLERLKAGTVEFTVKDEAGTPLEGVRFSYDSEPGITSSLRVKADPEKPGLYVCTQLEAGAWSVYVSGTEWKPKRVKVTVKEGETTKVSVTLAPK